ncbi:tetratricopeptide repeat protein [Streptomyces sp. NPDC005963]|uniref:ATP-binding protein n=1 Tax=Streptomyces sp. NPDC005963 TaxID=3156721 RepID=UPI00340709D0
MKSPKTLELLTALLITPGHRISHAGITRYLWPHEEPNANRIRQHFHHLRIGIPQIAQPNDRGFCQIKVDPQSVDHLRFHDFQRAADAAGNPSIRLKALRAALAEWRGTPLEDLPGEAFEQKRSELVAQLRNATVACAQTELECGEVLASLKRASAGLDRWPECESLLRLKVRALENLGRQDQVEPLLASWELRSGRPTVHLLLGDPDEPSPTPIGVRADVPRSQPRQLPSQPVDLIGRHREVEHISNTLLGRTAGRSRLAALTGMPGVGKTILAVWTATRIASRFPDGILYIDLGGFSQGEPERHGAVLARFLNDLKVRPATPTMDGMVSAYRTALAERAVLLILDNARDENHARPLLPGPGRSAAIVTSRRQLHGLAIREGAELVDLAPLGREDATELLRARIGDDRMSMAAPFADDIVEHCAGMPLALAIMAARIAQRPQALAGLVRELRKADTRLRSLDLGTEDLSVRLSLETSHNLLSETAVELLWRLAVYPGPTISWEALRALEPVGADGVGIVIDELIRMSLVTEPKFERYALHDLVRVYVDESTSRSDHERAGVVERVLRFLLHNAWACDRKLDPARRLPIGEAPDLQVVDPPQVIDAMSWFEEEYSTLIAAVDLAAKYRRDRFTWLLPMVLVTFQWRSGRHLDALKYLEQALDAARREGDPADVAMVHRMLAGTHRSLADLPRATRELRSAVRVSEDDGDVLGAALGRHILGVLLRESGAPGEALEHFTAALSDFKRLGDPLGQGAALNGIGCSRYDLGEYDVGLDHCRLSLALLEGTDDHNGLANLLFSLGRIRLALGDPESALADFERARDVYRSLAYGSREARTLIWLADTLRVTGRIEEAEEAMDRARLLMGELGESDLDLAVETLRNMP